MLSQNERMTNPVPDKHWQHLPDNLDQRRGCELCSQSEHLTQIRLKHTLLLVFYEKFCSAKSVSLARWHRRCCRACRGRVHQPRVGRRTALWRCGSLAGYSRSEEHTSELQS